MHRFAVAVGSTLYKIIRLRIPISGLKSIESGLLQGVCNYEFVYSTYRQRSPSLRSFVEVEALKV